MHVRFVSVEGDDELISYLADGANGTVPVKSKHDVVGRGRFHLDRF